MGAVLSPTDPVLASSVLKGRFAESHVPLQLRTLLSAESGANDGFALPPIMFSTLLICKPEGPDLVWSLLVDVLLHKILLAVLIGVVLGYAARQGLRLAERYELIDKESLVAFNVSLAMATLGLTTLLGTGEMLAVFSLGLTFSWDGWFQAKTAGTEFQAIMDTLFTLSFFVLFGASIPWTAFYELGWGRLVLFTGLVLALRRVPVTCFLSPFITQLKTGREALFAGWFGPMGVGALFYAWDCQLNGMNPILGRIVWFTVLGSILVHGATVPLFHIDTVRQTLSLLPEDEDEALEVLTILITEDSLSIDLSTRLSIASCHSPNHGPWAAGEACGDEQFVATTKAIQQTHSQYM